MKEAEITTTDKLVIQSIYQVTLGKNFKIEDEVKNSIENSFGIEFQMERDVYIVGMTAMEIYELIGEANIEAISKVNIQTFKKK